MIEINNTKALNGAEVKERGWTDTIISKFLGAPDAHRRNPRGRSAIRFFLLDRIEAVEATSDWIESTAKLRARRAKAAAIAKKARDERDALVAEQMAGLNEQAARLDVLAALFVINRQAKRYRDARQFAAMEKIYEYKGQVLEHMLRLGRLQSGQVHRLGEVYAQIVRGDGYCFHRPCPPPESVADVEQIDNRIESKPADALEPEYAVAFRCIELWLAEKEILPVYQWPLRKPICWACGQEGHLRHQCSESGEFDGW